MQFLNRIGSQESERIGLSTLCSNSEKGLDSEDTIYQSDFDCLILEVDNLNLESSDGCVRTNTIYNVGGNASFEADSCGPRLSSAEVVEEIVSPSFNFLEGRTNISFHPEECLSSVGLVDEIAYDTHDISTHERLVQGQPDVLVTRGQFRYVDDLIADVTFQDGAYGELGDSVGSCLLPGLDYFHDYRLDDDLIERQDCFDTLYSPVEVSLDRGSAFFQGIPHYRPCGSVCIGHHWLAGCTLQLNPCVFFDECFLSEGGADPNSLMIFAGINRGFKIRWLTVNQLVFMRWGRLKSLTVPCAPLLTVDAH